MHNENKEISDAIHKIEIDKDWHGSTRNYPTTNKGYAVDAAGHLKREGHLFTDRYIKLNQVQDIWKFNPNDYLKKWNRHIDIKSKLENYIINKGLHEIDRLGTPVITKTDWFEPSYKMYITDVSLD